MTESEKLEINDILKLIEIETGPDNPASANFCTKIKSDANFARFTLEVAHSLIKKASCDEELSVILIWLAVTAVTWISVLDPDKVKQSTRDSLGHLSPWSKEPAKTNSETTV
nr:hypothetical protein [Leptospira interrogans]